MTAYNIEELVSQAESGGCTLADVLSSKVSAEDLERMQQDLRRTMEENYRSIETFMSGVDVPSIADLSVLSGDVLDELEHELKAALSDETALAH
jgi:hypothetical protein